MLQPITGFHKDEQKHWDEEKHWIADLACGHTQHVRHRPPWELRPWVQTEDGRSSMLGHVLACKRCDEPNAKPH